MNTNSLLTLAEIVRRTGIDQHVLNRYVKLPENRAALMGASTHPQYPAEALPLFFRLAQEHSDHAVTPATLAARWRIDGVSVPAAVDAAEIAERSAHRGNGSMVRAERSVEIAEDGVALLRRLVEGIEQRPAPDDRVFDAAAAAEFLCCSTRLLRASVKPSFRLGRSAAGDRWYRRDLLRLR